MIGSSVEMKTLMVIVIFMFNAANIYGIFNSPNVKLKISRISNHPSIEYVVDPIIEIRNYRSIIYAYEIRLIAVKYESSQEFWWSMFIGDQKIKNQHNCINVQIPLEEDFDALQEVKGNKSSYYDGMELEIFKVFLAELNSKQLMTLNGCKTTNNDQKMYQSKIILKVYYHGKAEENNIWNISFTIHQNLYGFLQVMTEGYEINSNEENGIVFNYFDVHCENVAKSRKYYPTYYDKSELLLLILLSIGIFITFIVFAVTFKLLFLD